MGARAGISDSLFILVANDGREDEFAYIEVNLKTSAIVAEIVPRVASSSFTDFFDFFGFLGDGVVTENGYMNSHFYFQFERNVHTLILAGYNFKEKKVIYSDGVKRNSFDSLAQNSFDFTIGPFIQLPNGDYLASASSYDNREEYFNSGFGSQRMVLKVFSGEEEPKIKAAYIYEIPNGFIPHKINVLPDNTLLFIGNSIVPSSNFYPTYLNIGKSSAVGINENDGSQSLKYSLTNQGQTLQLFNPQLGHTEIYDANGKLLLEQYGNDQSVNISKLPPALYILRTQNQGENHYQMTNFIKP